MKYFLMGCALLLFILLQVQRARMKRDIKVLQYKVDSLGSENFIKDVQLMRYQNVVEMIAEKYPKAVEEAEYWTE